MDPSRRRKTRFAAALSAALLLAAALAYTSFSASSEAIGPGRVLRSAQHGRAYQLTGVVLWQATAFAVFALVIGVPLGLIAGRWLWRAAADRIGTDVGPTVPVVGMALAVAAVVVLANLLALVPAARAGRTHPAVELRAD